MLARTDDLRIEHLRPLLPPAILMEELPLSPEGAVVVSHTRAEIVDCLDGRDDRLVVVVGPCSVHDPSAAFAYAQRLRFATMVNGMVADGSLSAPVALSRDHLDAGSVASPNRETEGMRDGSDAIADWPVLNALLNASAGATWVSVHHGGGVGIGYSLHAGMVIVADGTADADRRLERVLTCDPGIGVVRHADAGYPEALATAEEHGIRLPMGERVH